MRLGLRHVGSNCFALTLHGRDIGSVFATEDDDPLPWCAVLNPRVAADDVRPPPFTSAAHRFESLQALQGWLGIAAFAPESV